MTTDSNLPSDSPSSSDEEQAFERPFFTLSGPSSRSIRTTIKAMFTKRYYNGRRRRLGKPSPQLPFILSVYKATRPDLFRSELRVSPRTFDFLVNLIIDDPVFQNNSNSPQMPVDFQLGVTLFRLGHFRNAMKLQKIANWAGTGKGTVQDILRRTLTALTRNRIKDLAMEPPTLEEKEKAKQWVEKETCKKWRNGYYFVDGTLVVLFCRPYYYGESYFDRKSNHSLNLQVLSLPNLRIVDFGYGFTGSTHDSVAWSSLQVAQNKTKILDDGEWIWADSAYTIETHVVAPYKSPDRNVPENAAFNEAVSAIRIKSEHAIGLLKGHEESRWNARYT